MSAPFHSNFGWHILKVEERRTLLEDRTSEDSAARALVERLVAERTAELAESELRFRQLAENIGETDLEPSTFPGGAAARAGSRGWFLAGDEAARALGPALAWAVRHDATLHMPGLPVLIAALLRRQASRSRSASLRGSGDVSVSR